MIISKTVLECSFNANVKSLIYSNLLSTIWSLHCKLSWKKAVVCVYLPCIYHFYIILELLVSTFRLLESRKLNQKVACCQHSTTRCLLIHTYIMISNIWIMLFHSAYQLQMFLLHVFDYFHNAWIWDKGK